MNIHSKDEFTDLIEVTAEYMNLDKRIVEKDYWVTYALRKLANSELVDDIIFRGGTSLTKCYSDLSRFSEDIDLAVNLKEGLTNNKIKKLVAAGEKVMCDEFNEAIDVEQIKGGKFREVEYVYKTVFSNFESIPMNELNPRIKIESVTFIHPNPYEKRKISSFLHTYLDSKNMKDEIEEYELEPFYLNVLSNKRTVVDKLVCLVRMSYEEGLTELLSKTRHLYDIHMTYNSLKEFYENEDELRYIVSLTRADEEGENSLFKEKYPYKEKWSKAPLFTILDSSSIKDNFINNFCKEFVYGEYPNYENIMKTFEYIKVHLESIGE